MRNTLLATMAVLTLAAGSASAAQLTDQTEIVFTVDSACAFDVQQSQINGSVGAVNDGSGFITYTSNLNSVGNINAVCSNGVTYTIETDAAAGGSNPLLGDTTGGTVPAYIYQGYNSMVPFGSQANGEHYSGTANGEFQTIDFRVVVNSHDGGTTPLAIPVADTYRDMLNWTFTH